MTTSVTLMADKKALYVVTEERESRGDKRMTERRFKKTPKGIADARRCVDDGLSALVGPRR